VFSCTYNGWSDAPEEEREALDAYDAAVALAALAWTEPVRSQEAPTGPVAEGATSPIIPPVLRHAA
jgi:hypothetical protein